MRRLALALAFGIVCIALPAGATPAQLRNASWADNRHGWVECRERDICATEDGGRNWQHIFTGGNYIFSLVRTSATSGVTQTGNLGGFSFWTRDNGAHWYELPNVPSPSYKGGEKAPCSRGGATSCSGTRPARRSTS